MNQGDSSAPKLDLALFTEDLIKTWRAKEKDEAHYKKFVTLSKDELKRVIDFLIEELEEIKAVNKLIRLKESLNTVFDLKLLYNNLKITIVSNY